MSEYSLNKKIKSTFVSLVLLQEVEKYLLEQGKSLCENDDQIIYKAMIDDKFGTERIDSFVNYHRSTLPNEAKRVALGVRDSHYNQRIEISFSRDKDYSDLKVVIDGDSAKEKAIGIATAIESRLNEHKNLNFLFHSWLTYFLLFTFGIVFGATLADFIKKDINIGTLIGSFIVLITIIYFGLKSVNPYSVLDTNRNRQRASFVKWILNGLAGVFLFGLLATLIRKYLTGF
ncbi:MAG: hypothetical protein ACTSSH_11620 [Candidatus Heimdallarchaeota archaeon]